jgi:gamma-glutamyltranspeptidase/glutathione hydrolase
MPSQSQRSECDGNLMHIESSLAVRLKRPAVVVFAFAFVTFLHAGGGAPQRGDDVGERQVAKAAKAMVAGPDRYATEAALDILHQGGNAVDAAVAAALVAMVAEPNMVAFGGFGSLITFDAATHKTRFVTFWMQYPDDFHPNANAGPGAYVIAPGAPRGLDYVAGRYGRLPIKALVKPAIHLARDGFPVYGTLFGQMFERYGFLTATAEGRQQWTRAGFLPEPGTTFKQEALARTLEAFGNLGADAIYSGAFAQNLVDTVHRYGGTLSSKDLRDYEVMDVEAGRSTYRGYELRSSWPPDSGGIGVALGLNILEALDLKKTGHYTESVESAYNVYATLRTVQDLTRYVRDPAVYGVPDELLLSKSFAVHQAEQIRYEKALAERSRKLHSSDAASDPVGARPGGIEELSTGTVHISIIDENGNACAITTSIAGDTFGQSGIVVDGVLMNGSGHFRGSTQDKRWSSAAAPTILFKDGRPAMVVGSPSDIYSTMLQVIPNVIDFGMDPQEAVSVPRLYLRRPQFTDTSAQYLLETRFKQEILDGLKALGASVDFRGSYANPAGSARVVVRDQQTGELFGGVDPRRPGLAKGY